MFTPGTDHKMPLYQTKTIANILEPVAQQVSCQHTETVARLSPVHTRNFIAMSPVTTVTYVTMPRVCR